MWIQILKYLTYIHNSISCVFQAVVNEDTQGNVLSLQQEIKRLNEQLSAFMSGEISSQPGAPGIVYNFINAKICVQYCFYH